ncbi:MAG: leucine--tRNA ligase, partial [Aureliella sp.]
NWCPGLGTVLANEEVIDGRSERGDHPVQRIPLRQWMLRITAYAERLLRDLDSLDWSPGIKKLQADWIGRSVGAEVDFYLGSKDDFAQWRSQRRSSGMPARAGSDALRVYTTRPDTLFGATYMVIAPEHPLVVELTQADQRASVEAYRQSASFKSDRERTEGDRKKTGVFTGSYAINPVNEQPIPIWIADYVLASYGTGAIMAVPAHDERDFEFAQQFDLPIVPVVDPGAQAEDRQAVLEGARCGSSLGTAINSGRFSGLSSRECQQQITAELTENGLGREAVNYKLRDWLFSRQRFWGEPFPILHELDERGEPTGAIRAVEASELPVDLPHLDDYKPHGRPEPPLAKAPDEWLFVERDGRRYRRETNTMPQWAGSCWYFLRFIDPHNDRALCDPEKERAWMPIDLYVGGAEHAVLHLLYSRFWHKVLYDRGHVTTAEPFQKLVNQGMILGEVEYTAYQDADGRWTSPSEVRREEDGSLVHKQTGQPLVAKALAESDVLKQGDGFVLADHPEVRVDSRAHKMSKSRGNVVNPDHVVKEYGADSLRLYEMFMGPLEATKPWSMAGVSGVRNFLDRVWRMIVDARSDQLELLPAVQRVEPTGPQLRTLHRTIAAVTRDLESLSFNTAIARLMECVNFFNKEDVRPHSAMETFVLLLAPLAPHIAEELWKLLGHQTSLACEPWPQYDEAFLKDEEVEVVVQVNGKIRARITVPPELDQAALESQVRQDARLDEWTGGKTIVKAIIVPGRLVNFVVK